MSTDTKPRICEVLGGKDNPLEVGERFKVVDSKFAYDSAWLEVTQDGYVAVAPNTPEEQKSHSAAILAIHAINHPESIIREPRVTEDEVAQAREIVHVFGREDTIRRTEDGLLCYGGIILNKSLLPSLRKGQSVTIAEVIGKGDGAACAPW